MRLWLPVNTSGGSLTGNVGNSSRQTGSESAAVKQFSLLEEADSASLIEPLTWRVRTNARIKNPKIQVFPHGGVEVVVHPRTRPRDIEAFVIENSAWIEKTRLAFQQLRPAEQSLPDRIELAATGENLAVHYTGINLNRARDVQGILTVDTAKIDPAQCWPVLQSWLKRKAAPHLKKAVAEQSALTGLKPKRVQVRLQSTRWGSCSTTGTLSLNAALLLRSPAELRYVVIHELCHLEHMNHSKRYWQLVKHFEPDYRRYERGLDKAWKTSPAWLIS
jgi:predicted metal-dependent hydrolase